MRWSCKIVFGCGLVFLALNGIAPAETVYVTDELRLGLREGPGSNYEIVDVARSGQVLELLNVEGRWARVRLTDGQEGWVLERYLTRTMTGGLKLERLRAQYDSLRNQAENLREENRRLNREVQQLRTELKQNSRTAAEATEAYEALKNEASEYLQLKTRYENAARQLTEQTQQLEELNARIDALESQRTIRWLLTGAGVVLFGFIVGVSIRKKRRSSLLS